MKALTNAGKRQIVGILTGIAVFIIASLCWSFIAAFIAWALHLDPSETWWQRVGYFVVFFLPGLALAFGGACIAGRVSDPLAFRITFYTSLTLVVVGFATCAVLYPY